MTKDEVIEKLASLEHERWAGWQQWVHDQGVINSDGSLTIPAEWVERWERQIHTPYEALSEREKQADRDEVARHWPLVEAYASGKRESG